MPGSTDKLNSITNGKKWNHTKLEGVPPLASKQWSVSPLNFVLGLEDHNSAGSELYCITVERRIFHIHSVMLYLEAASIELEALIRT